MNFIHVALFVVHVIGNNMLKKLDGVKEGGIKNETYRMDEEIHGVLRLFNVMV